MAWIIYQKSNSLNSIASHGTSSASRHLSPYPPTHTHSIQECYCMQVDQSLTNFIARLELQQTTSTSTITIQLQAPAGSATKAAPLVVDLSTEPAPLPGQSSPPPPPLPPPPLSAYLSRPTTFPLRPPPSLIKCNQDWIINSHLPAMSTVNNLPQFSYPYFLSLSCFFCTALTDAAESKC